MSPIDKLQQAQTLLLANGFTLETEVNEEDFVRRTFTGQAKLVTDGTGTTEIPAGLEVNVTDVTLCAYKDGYTGLPTFIANVGIKEDECDLMDKYGEDFSYYGDEGLEIGVNALLGINVAFADFCEHQSDMLVFE